MRQHRPPPPVTPVHGSHRHVSGRVTPAPRHSGGTLSIAWLLACGSACAAPGPLPSVPSTLQLPPQQALTHFQALAKDPQAFSCHSTARPADVPFPSPAYRARLVLRQDCHALPATGAAPGADFRLLEEDGRPLALDLDLWEQPCVTLSEVAGDGRWVRRGAVVPIGADINLEAVGLRQPDAGQPEALYLLDKAACIRHWTITSTAAPETGPAPALTEAALQQLLQTGDLSPRHLATLGFPVGAVRCAALSQSGPLVQCGVEFPANAPGSGLFFGLTLDAGDALGVRGVTVRLARGEKAACLPWQKTLGTPGLVEQRANAPTEGFLPTKTYSSTDGKTRIHLVGPLQCPEVIHIERSL